MRCIRSGSLCRVLLLVMSLIPIGVSGRTDVFQLALPLGESVEVYRIEPEDGPERAPAIVLFHGGGWTAGSPSQLFPHAEAFARAGFVCLLPAYPLASAEAGLSETVAAAEAIAARIVERADEFGLDADRLYLLGESAGGHLAAMIASRPRPSPWAGVILWNPVLDLRKLGWLEKRHGPPEDLDAWSPVNFLSEFHPPALVLHGENDTVVEPSQIEAWYEAAKRLKLPVRFDLLPDLGHAFAYPRSEDAPGEGFRIAMQRSLTFLRVPAVAVALPDAAFDIIHAFDGTTGWQPFAELSLNGDEAWAGTHRGGEEGQGTLFRIDLSEGRFEMMHSLQSGEGREPYTGLTFHDGAVWGITKFGGPHEQGTLFRFDPAGREFAVIHGFNRREPKSWGAHAGPILVDGQFYGTTFHGGENTWSGTVYRAAPDGTSFEILKSFDPMGGEHLTGQLLEHNGWLYGMTSDYEKGPGRAGTIFRLRPDGTEFSVVHRFAGGGLGGHPYDRLIPHPDGYLLGTTFGAFGDPYDRGTVFAFFPETETFITLLDFNLVPHAGGKPNGSLVVSEDARELFLTTHGSTDPEAGFPGTALRLLLASPSPDVGTTGVEDVALSRIDILHTFNGGSHGHTPMRTPLVRDGVLWGATAFGSRDDLLADDPTKTGGLLYRLAIPALEVPAPADPDAIDQPVQPLTRSSILFGGIFIIGIALWWNVRFPGPPIPE